MLLICSLTFCSLGSNQITAEGAHAVAAALQVNQSLQELKLVGPLLSYFLKRFTLRLWIESFFSLVPRLLNLGTRLVILRLVLKCCEGPDDATLTNIL